VFSATVWNFNLKFYTFIFWNVLQLTFKWNVILLKNDEVIHFLTWPPTDFSACTYQNWRITLFILTIGRIMFFWREPKEETDHTSQYSQSGCWLTSQGQYLSHMSQYCTRARQSLLSPITSRPNLLVRYLLTAYVTLNTLHSEKCTQKSFQCYENVASVIRIVSPIIIWLYAAIVALSQPHLTSF